MQAETLLTFDLPVKGPEGHAYRARACGRVRDDGLYEGWLEFEDAIDGPVVRTRRETTQPNHADLLYWASGLTAVYLEGALARALEPRLDVTPMENAPPAFAGPREDVIVAPPPVPPDAGLPAPPFVDAVLDPFSVFAKGEDLLRRQLEALAHFHLRNIALAYHFVEDAAVAEALDEGALIERIVAGVRRGYAAIESPASV